MSYQSNYTGQGIDDAVAKVGESGDTLPFYAEGIAYYLAGKVFYSGFDGEYPSQVTDSSTGAAKTLLERFMRSTPPVMVIRGSNPGSTAAPTFIPLYANVLNTAGSLIAYESDEIDAIGGRIYVTVAVDRIFRQLSLAKGTTLTPAAADTAPLLPFISHIVLQAAGQLSTAVLTTCTASSTGNELAFYNRFQKGFPPAVAVAVQDPAETAHEAWLTQTNFICTQADTCTAQYESCAVTNGGATGKKIRLMVQRKGTDSVVFMASLV